MLRDIYSPAADGRTYAVEKFEIITISIASSMDMKFVLSNFTTDTEPDRTNVKVVELY